jgi:hypothetical protein
VHRSNKHPELALKTRLRRDLVTGISLKLKRRDLHPETKLLGQRMCEAHRRNGTLTKKDNAQPEPERTNYGHLATEFPHESGPVADDNDYGGCQGR